MSGLLAQRRKVTTFVSRESSSGRASDLAHGVGAAVGAFAKDHLQAETGANSDQSATFGSYLLGRPEDDEAAIES